MSGESARSESEGLQIGDMVQAIEGGHYMNDGDFGVIIGKHSMHKDYFLVMWRDPPRKHPNPTADFLGEATAWYCNRDVMKFVKKVF